MTVERRIPMSLQPEISSDLPDLFDALRFVLPDRHAEIKKIEVDTGGDRIARMNAIHHLMSSGRSKANSVFEKPGRISDARANVRKAL